MRVFRIETDDEDTEPKEIASALFNDVLTTSTVLELVEIDATTGDDIAKRIKMVDA